MTLPVFYQLSPGSYGAIVADPPWSFLTYSGNHTTPHRCAEDHYDTMTLEGLSVLPVASLAAKDCALFLWVVDSHLDVGIELGRKWGFKFKTRAFEWLKTKKKVEILEDGAGYASVDFGISMGYWTRKQTESCLLFTRGSPRRMSKGVRQVIAAPRREHSRKPDELYKSVEQLVAGPYCELFAKRRWPGWDGWGDEYPPLDNKEAEILALTAAVRGMIDGLR